MNQELLRTLVRQILQLAIMGNFNGYQELWGCERTEPRRIVVEETITKKNCIILSDGTATHILWNRLQSIRLCTQRSWQQYWIGL